MKCVYLKGCCQYKSNCIHDLFLNVDLWHATSCISLLKWEHWGKFDFVCELWILEGKETENIYEHFGLQCAVLVLNTACVIPVGYKQMNGNDTIIEKLYDDNNNNISQ